MLGFSSFGVGLEVVLMVWLSIKWWKSVNIHVICSRIVVVRKSCANIGIISGSEDSRYGN